MDGLHAQDPRRIGDYEVLGRLGAGGMGQVYLARSPAGAKVALKVIRSEYATDPTFRARFRKEVHAAQAVGGPYTARVVDAGSDAEQPWMATEFVQGPSLQAAVLERGPLSEAAVLTLAGALAEALAAIHDKGLVHRDLKPANILLAYDGPRVIDFGVVRALESTSLTATGSIVGTVGYTSPEQIRSDADVGPASDVFALGAVLAFAASGSPPFGHGLPAVVLMRILQRDADLSGVPQRIRKLVEACLQDAPQDRPEPRQLLRLAGHDSASVQQATGHDWLSHAGKAAVEGHPPTALDGTPERPGAGLGPPASQTPSASPDRPAAPPTRRRALLSLFGAGVAAAGVGSWFALRDDSSSAPATVVWRYSVPALGGTLGPVAALSPNGDTLYVGAVNGLHAVDTGNGGRRWVRHSDTPVSTPVVDGTGIYYCSYADGRLYALEPSGSPRWDTKAGDSILAMPALAASYVWIGWRNTDGTGHLESYAPDNPDVGGWDITLPSLPTSPLVTAGDVTYASAGNVLTARNVKDSSEKWVVEFDSEIALPAVSGRTIFISSDSSERPLHGVTTGGKLKWTKKHRGGGRHSSLTATHSTAFTVVDGALLATGEDGDLLWSYRPDDGVPLAPNTATASGETVYVHGGESLYAVDLKGELRWQVKVGQPVTGTTARPLVRGSRIYAAGPKGVAAIQVRDSTDSAEASST